MSAAGLCVYALSKSNPNISGFIMPELTKNLLDLNQMPLRLMFHPSIYSLHPLLHPFMAAMGPCCHGYCVLAAKPRL